MGQLAQAAEVALEARELGGRGVVGLTQGLAGIRLLLPQAGAEREQQVTGQQLDHLQEPGARAHTLINTSHQASNRPCATQLQTQHLLPSQGPSLPHHPHHDAPWAAGLCLLPKWHLWSPTLRGPA